MNLILYRYRYSSKSTLGLLYINGVFRCYTLEDAHRDIKVKGSTCIPEGVYKLGLRDSPKFTPKYGHEMIWIQGVPGFDYILIHPGNTIADTEGCILVGDGIEFSQEDETQGDYLSNSKATYLRCYPLISTIIQSGDTSIEIKSITS